MDKFVTRTTKNSSQPFHPQYACTSAQAEAHETNRAKANKDAEKVDLIEADDLGKERPNQVKLACFPQQSFGNRKRGFVASWYIDRDWLEYSVKKDAAFCYPCRQFSGEIARLGQGIHGDSSFTQKGFRDWKHATGTNNGFHKHSTAKDHITCYAIWKEREKRCEKGKEISTLLTSEQIARNRYYISSIVDVLEFLVSNQLPLRGTSESFVSMLDADGGNGLFLSLLEFSIRKDSKLAEIVKSIPKNASYTSHDIQNQLLSAMSSVVTEAIIEEVGEAWYTLKADGTKDPTGTENVSIVVRYFHEKTRKITERLLTMTTSQLCDAQSLTDLICSNLETNGLSLAKMLSQVYDGAAVMSGRCGGVQRLIQIKAEREIPYVHCFNHQLHLVVVKAIAAEQEIEDFFNVCDALYNFFRKPTVAVDYCGHTLKCLMTQRWTGHQASVNTIVSSFDEIFSALKQISIGSGTCGSNTETRIEATGLIREVSKASFLFIAKLMSKVNIPQITLIKPIFTVFHY